MSIEFNMTNAQELGKERFVWGISNSGISGNGCKKIEKKLSTLQSSHPSKIEIPMTKKTEKGKKRMKRNDKNHNDESLDHKIHIWTERERRKKMTDMYSKLHVLLPQLPPKTDKSSIVDKAVSYVKSLEQTVQKLEMKKLEKLQYYLGSATPFIYDPSASSSSRITLLTPISNHPQVLPIDNVAADSYPRESFLTDKMFSSTKNMPYPCTDPIVAFDTWSSRNIVLSICGNEAFFNMCFPIDKSEVFSKVCYLFEKYNIEVLYANVSSNVFRRTYMIQTQVNPNCETQLLKDGSGVGEIFKQAAQELVTYVSSS